MTTSATVPVTWAAFFLSASAAVAQPIIVTNIPFGCGGTFGCGGAPMHVATGNLDLDRAMAICDQHPAQTTISTIPPSPDYAPPYEASCRKVEAAWEKSDAARQLKERKTKDKADLDFLNGFAGKLP